MSWIERIKSGIEVVTGDGKTYNPLYLISAKTVGYNVATFEFPEIEGTLVKRGTPQGARYSFDLIFQGDDNIDQMHAFEQSAKDRRPWQVLHPLYEKLTLHPTSIKYDPTGLNVSKITCELIETITDDAPRMSVDAFDEINNGVENQTETSAEEFAASFIPVPADVNTMTAGSNSVYEVGASSIQSGEQSNEYLLLYNAATAGINNLLADVSAAATSVNSLFVYPASFDSEIKTRIEMLQAQFAAISLNVADLFSANEKAIYEMYAGALINAAVSAAVNPLDGDYNDTDSVQYVADILAAMQADYIQNLDLLQSATASEIDAYVPNYVLVSGVANLVSLTISSLLGLAVGTRQRRTVILEADSNPILLAHRFYGITAEETTVDEFIRQNNIGMRELLGIRAGREVIYYV